MSKFYSTYHRLYRINSFYSEKHWSGDKVKRRKQFIIKHGLYFGPLFFFKKKLLPQISKQHLLIHCGGNGNKLEAHHLSLETLGPNLIEFIRSPPSFIRGLILLWSIIFGMHFNVLKSTPYM